MAKELLLYSGISNYSAELLIKSVEEFKREAIAIRINSGGGDTQATWGICAKISEHGNVKLKVDGVAFSSAGNMLFYAKSVECLDVSTFGFHRAAPMYASDDSPELKQFLAKVNTDLRAKMEAKIDSTLLKAMKGMTVADLFEGEERKLLFLNASEAEKLGIVSKVNTLNPEEIAAYSDMYMKIAAELPINTSQNQNSNFMTLAELKEKHPQVYAEVFALGKVEGITIGKAEETDRIGAAMVFAHIDPKGVQEIIKSGKPMTATQQAEMLLKSTSPEFLAKVKAEATPAIKTDEVPVGGKKDTELGTFEASVRAEMGLDKTEGKQVVLVTEKVAPVAATK